MNKSIILSVLLFYSISTFAQSTINQTDQQGRKQGYWQKRDNSGKLLYEGTFKDDRPVGEMKRFSDNGQVKALLNYDETSDSVQTTLFNEKEEKIATGKYVGQQKTGEWKYFNNGKLISSETYKDNVKNGIAKKYYPSGELFEESNWKNNLKDGVYKTFYKNGKSLLECMYKGGLLDGWCISYYPNGEMETESFFQNNLKQNEWKVYSDNGTLQYTLRYEKGVLVTPEILDSIQNLKVSEFEKNRGKILDPEQFLSDPSTYIMQDRMNK